MNRRAVYACCILATVLYSVAVQATEPADKASDPLPQLLRSFPESIELKNGGRLLEFCPDGTCDGFVVSGSMPVTTLKDFAYLYVYFFSDYTFLDEWRRQSDAKNTAERVLSKPEYRRCKTDSSREAARCVLRDLSGNSRVRLIFIRYDEGKRSVVRENLAEKLQLK